MSKASIETDMRDYGLTYSDFAETKMNNEQNKDLAEYELINPSDPYTFLAESHEIAALTVFILSTMYGAKSKSGEEEVPLFLFGGSEEWYVEQFGRTPAEGIDALKKGIAEALDSFMLGDFEDRRRYNAALNAITDEDKKKQFKVEWQDGRSSLNDIGAFAHRTAKKLFAALEKENVK